MSTNSNPSIKSFLEELDNSIKDNQFVKLTLSKKRSKQDSLKLITVDLKTIKSVAKAQVLYRHDTQDITKNHELENVVAEVTGYIGIQLLQGLLQTTTNEYQLLINKKGKATLKSVSKNINVDSTLSKHDKVKKTFIDLKGNVYLRELGLISSNDLLLKEKYSKFRQINKFIEITGKIINDQKTDKPLHIADMGCGKGYLTFALYDYLVNHLSRNIEFTGIELRPNLVENSNQLTTKCGFTNLNFREGYIGKVDFDQLDVLIALHACDTATDDAIYQGIKSDCSIIICSPCCHKAFRKAMKSDTPISKINKHGILQERQAELATDALRALILEANGYKTNIAEFISSEHTGKNLLITAIKKKVDSNWKKQKLKEIEDFKKLFGIQEYYLERLLKGTTSL